MHSHLIGCAGFPDLPKPPADTAIGSSQSVTKLEAWMRFANLHYRKGACLPSHAPKGQVDTPYTNWVLDTCILYQLSVMHVHHACIMACMHCSE